VLFREPSKQTKPTFRACISEHFLRIQESFKTNARNLRIYKRFHGFIAISLDIISVMNSKCTMKLMYHPKDKRF
jgi:hypothetical protein